MPDVCGVELTISEGIAKPHILNDCGAGKSLST
jgi:hypothetical protein